MTMDRAIYTALSAVEAADRLAIRELFDAYAHCADCRDAAGQKALFTADTRFAVYMKGEQSEPTYVLQGRDALTPVFAELNQYEATTHFNGQSTVALDGGRATGESYTIAHHLFTAAGSRKIMIASFVRPGKNAAPGVVPVESIDFRIINIASNGPVVMTERVDVFKLPGKSFELQVMGTFEVREGKISV